MSLLTILFWYWATCTILGIAMLVYAWADWKIFLASASVILCFAWLIIPLIITYVIVMSWFMKEYDPYDDLQPGIVHRVQEK